MVGNGATNWDVDADASYAEVFAYFNIVPFSLLEQYQKYDCKYYWGDIKEVDNAKECDEIWENLTVDTSGKITNLNIYDLFR